MTIDLEAIKARAAAATAGPWFFTGYCAIQSAASVQRHEDFWTDERTEDNHTYEHRAGQTCEGCGVRWTVPHVEGGPRYQVWDCAFAGAADDAEPTVATVKPSYGDTATGQRVVDAKFIAAARDDVPELVAEVERLRAWNGQAQIELDADHAEIGRLTAIVEAVHDLHRTHTASLFTTQHDREAVAAVGCITPYQHRCRPHCREDRLRCRCGKTDCPTAAALAD